MPLITHFLEVAINLSLNTTNRQGHRDIEVITR